MTIKPWLSRNFMNQMRWSNVRDYPPKRKKPWLSGNFMEMEEVNVAHLDLFPPGSPLGNGDLPLPPPPEIPQDPDDILEEIDPCVGSRTLWVIANPSTIDCDVSRGLTLIFSPDFQCIELTQAFYDPDGPILLDSADNNFEHPTNVNDIVGGLRISLAAVCDEGDPSPITLWASECLCGGVATVDIGFTNCGVDCGVQAIDGPSSISPDSQYQYTLVNITGSGGEVTWSIGGGTGVSVDSETGIVTTTSSACGGFTLNAEDSCCGTTSRVLTVNVGYWKQTVLCDTGLGGATGSCSVPIAGQASYIQYTLGPCSAIDSCGNASCSPTSCPESSAWYPDNATISRVKYEYLCPP